MRRFIENELEIAGQISIKNCQKNYYMNTSIYCILEAKQSYFC